MSMRKRTLPQGWYPGSADECNREIDEFLKGFTPPKGMWRGAVVPHAGWFFSGRAAARAISTIAGSVRADRVVIYGGHLPEGKQPIIYTDDSWDTPLGPQPLDSATSRKLVSAGEGVEADKSLSDNTVEIQLPLVRRFFPEVPIIAVHSPASDKAVRLGEAVSALLEAEGFAAVYIGSADLTHYGPNYGFTPKGRSTAAVEWVKQENDRSLINKALAMDAHACLLDAKSKQNTCSAGPIASVIASMSRHSIVCGRLLEYYTSYDIAPDSSFVGYAAIVY